MAGRAGLFLSGPTVLTLALAAAGAIVTYVFATKLELATVAQAASTRITVVEETVKHHDEALIEIKKRAEDMDENIRTLMIQQGVAPTKIRGSHP